MNNKYTLSITSHDNFYRGVYKAVLFYDQIELIFFEEIDSTLKQVKCVSLAPDRVSFFNSLQNTRDKIKLICQRLGIEEKELGYDKSSLPLLEQFSYKTLFLAKMFYKMFIPMQWVIVYKQLDSELNKASWHKIIPPKEVFQADPFIIYKNNKYYVFYEELKFADYHGYLAVAELDLKSGKLVNAKTILKLDYHLSYPFVFEENNHFYMIPETGDHHAIDLYECTSFPYQWQKKQTLIDNIQAVDSTLLKHDGAWYLFTSEKVKGANYDDELSIYKTEDLFNQPFKKLYNDPVITDVKKARMAGKFIHRGGDILRISQNSGKRYGYRANINKVLQIEGGYKEEKIGIIDCDDKALGFHTYNEAEGIAVGDQLIARFDFYSLKRFIGGNLKRVLF
ncbi:MAG: hypothetical protein DSZ29_02410 [Aquificaceae bacterium]|nr:MAG: hypothetical protein DSZ29_02410 [Aquificaceae bacterium]